MHVQQHDFLLSVRDAYPAFFDAKFVLEIGSLNVNGSARVLFSRCVYLGVDVIEGRDVDMVCFAHNISLEAGRFDTVISCEALEHDMYWQKTLAKAVEMLRSGGLLILTCAGPTRAPHGTRTVCPYESGTSRIPIPEVADYYRGLTEEDLRSSLDVAAFESFAFVTDEDGMDIYFWGIKA